MGTLCEAVNRHHDKISALKRKKENISTKKKTVAGYGGIITFCDPTLQARESTLARVVEKTGARETILMTTFP